MAALLEARGLYSYYGDSHILFDVSLRVETVELLKSIAKGRTMVVIDHDIDSLFELAERVTVLQEGRVLVEGTPEEIRNDARVQEAYLGGMDGEMAA